jgi:tripartite-type tricarboxylate transporter receptor subunit TctC
VHNTLRRAAATTLITLGAFDATAFAQSYPARPIRLIVPFPPSGSSDVYARLLAKEIGTALGQTVVVDNRPGGTGIIGTEAVKNATPDGHTLLFTSNTAHVIAPLLRTPRPFDPVSDFTPITVAVRFPQYLVANAKIPAKTIQEFVVWAKTQQGRLNYSSSGEGGYSHIAGLLFGAATGISATHLPYKGAGPALLAVVSGEVHYLFNNVGTAQPFITSGRMRGYALTGTARVPAVPDIPTLSEVGIKDLEGIYTWLGLLGPPRLPGAIRDRVASVTLSVLKSPEIAQKAAADGYDIVASSPARFAKDMRQEIATVEPAIKTHGLRAAP